MGNVFGSLFLISTGGAIGIAAAAFGAFGPQEVVRKKSR